MRTKQRSLVREVPLIAVGFAIVAVGAVAATVVAESARVVIRVVNVVRPLPCPRPVH